MERTETRRRGGVNRKYTGLARVAEARRWLLKKYLDEVDAADAAPDEATERQHREAATRIEVECRDMGFDVREPGA